KWYCLEENGQFSKHRCRSSAVTPTNKSMSNAETESILKDQPVKTQPCPCLPKLNKKSNKQEKHKKNRKRHTHH
ncbi:hypothetical protein BgiBS90_029931, partial [Biomphalaria glabrata]